MVCPRKVVLLSQIVICLFGFKAMAGPDRPATSTAVDAFTPLRDWWYRGAAWPDGREQIEAMMEELGDHPDDPNRTQWAAVALARDLFRTTRDPLDLFRKAAEAGEPFAKTRLGKQYLLGDGVPKDSAKGLALYEDALADGESTAALFLGEAHLNGIGVDRDSEKSLAYYQQALEMGNVRAYAPIAEHHRKNGEIDRAIALFEKGADAGDPGSMLSLAFIYQSGLFGQAPNAAKALQFFSRAAERDEPAAMRELAKATILGNAGVRQTQSNFALAQRMLSRAANGQDLEARRLLARVYLTGEIDMSYRPELAVSILRESSDKGDTIATYELAVLYVEGLAIERDLNEALKLMKIAAAADYKPAKAYLTRLEANLATTEPSEASRAIE